MITISAMNTYRSKGLLINQADDMVRLVLDMGKNDYYKLIVAMKKEDIDYKCCPEGRKI